MMNAVAASTSPNLKTTFRDRSTTMALYPHENHSKNPQFS